MLCLTRSLYLLVAEDDEDDVVLLRCMFSDLEFRGVLRFVKSGRELFDYLRESKASQPDAILVDIRMPLMDGFEILAAIRSDRDFDDVPVILMSGSEPYYKMLKSQYEELEIEAVLFKPVTAAALVEVLRKFNCCTRPC